MHVPTADAVFSGPRVLGRTGLRVGRLGLAASYVARLIERYHWINYIGLVVIIWVACNMIYDGFVGGEHVLGLRQVLGLG